MNLAVLGSGGREHAICYKLKQSSKIKKLFCIPGNAGNQKIAQNIREDISNFEKLYQFIKKNGAPIVVKADGFFRKDIGRRIISSK